MHVYMQLLYIAIFNYQLGIGTGRVHVHRQGSEPVHVDRLWTAELMTETNSNKWDCLHDEYI